MRRCIHAKAGYCMSCDGMDERAEAVRWAHAMAEAAGVFKQKILELEAENAALKVQRDSWTERAYGARQAADHWFNELQSFKSYAERLKQENDQLAETIAGICKHEGKP